MGKAQQNILRALVNRQSGAKSPLVWTLDHMRKVGRDLGQSKGTGTSPNVTHDSAISVRSDERERAYASDPCTSSSAGTLRGCAVFSVAGDKPDSSFMNWKVGLSGVFANGLAACLTYGAVTTRDTISYDEFTLGIRYQMR